MKEESKKVITDKECYEIFEKTGISYGAGYRSVKEMYIGENEVLARLELPEGLEEGKEEYVLHPSMIEDGALQASIGLMLSVNKNEYEIKLSLPYALEGMEAISKNVLCKIFKSNNDVE